MHYNVYRCGHVIGRYTKYGITDVKACWNKALTGKAGLRTLVHHKEGIFFMSLVFVLIFLLHQKIAVLFAIAYYSHIFLDSVVSAKSMRNTFVTRYVSLETLLNFVLLVSIGLTVL